MSASEEVPEETRDDDVDSEFQEVRFEIAIGPKPEERRRIYWQIQD